MTSLQRVRAALSRRPADRVPRLLYEEAIGYTPPVARMLAERCAPKAPRDYFGMDITRVVEGPSALPLERFEPWYGQAIGAAISAGEVDEWGVWWRSGDFHHFAEVQSPLKNASSIGELESYPWPDLDEPGRFAGVAERVRDLHRQGLAVAAFAGSIFERAWYLRGMQELMIDMHESPRFARALLERCAYHQRCAAGHFARAGVDIVITGDDVAGQHGMLMSIPMWQDYLKPLQTATARAIKEAGAYVFYHSDGNVAPLIPELIETGIDILNPIQPECMDPAAIKEQFGERLCFWGTVSVQQTMPLGTPEQVRAEVRRRIATVGRGGGLILAPAHVLGPEVPWENVVAFFEAADATPLC